MNRGETGMNRGETGWNFEAGALDGETAVAVSAGKSLSSFFSVSILQSGRPGLQFNST